MRASETVRVILVMGVSGAGKTTIGLQLATALGWRFLDGDELHSAESIRKLSKGIPLTDADRRPWLSALRAAIGASVKSRAHVVIACSALKASFRKTLLSGHADEVRLVYLKADRTLLRRRLAQRTNHFMSETLLASQLATLEEPSETEALVLDADETVTVLIERIRSAFALQRLTSY